MSLTLHYHPLSSFCWKVLIALYEKDVPFTPHMLNPGDPASWAAFTALWPVAKMPVLEDGERGAMVPETSIIIDYLDAHYPEPRLIPDVPDAARAVRLADRIYDNYVQVPMQKIIADRLRPDGDKDPFGVAEARAMLAKSCDMIERDMAGRTWAVGDDFSMADCAAAPAFFYANEVMPLADTHPALLAYLRRLEARPSVARVLAEAQPYFQYFPRV